MRRLNAAAAIAVILATTACVRGADPFSVTVAAGAASPTGAVVTLSFSIPAHHHIYADQVSVTNDVGSLTFVDGPKPVRKADTFTGEERDVYESDFARRYRLSWGGHPAVTLTVEYQGCSEQLCFLPTRTRWEIRGDGTVQRLTGAAPAAAAPPAAAPDGDWRALAERFHVRGRQGGYLKTGDFISFLDGSAAATPGLGHRGAAATLLLILIWGLALNLTPCVLPMIPINLAIIGAGTEAGSRGRGFALGALYGAGMALAYGLLGAIVVATGATFGSLNASPWFNLAIAVLFVFLSLAMFGVFHIDFSRFQSGVRAGAGGGSGGRYVAAPMMGAVAALLAGACVAPAVIAVLAYSAGLYAAGSAVGLVLPFVLGLGMALPWPFAGAGFAFLPKPGKWMEYMEYAFGVLILGAALYYAHGAYTGFAWQSAARRAAVVEAQMKSLATEGWTDSLVQGLRRAHDEGKPAFIDFWASWCKSCLAMDRTTFQDAGVRKRLDSFVKIKYRAERPGDSPDHEILEYFRAVGLPTYVILEPNAGGREQASKSP